MIELKHIRKVFAEKEIFSDFNYTFQAGVSYALIGESGSGKTTLLNIIGKLEDFDVGQVSIENTPLSRIKEKDYFRHYISYLFQNYGLIEQQSIKDNLELAFVGQKLSTKDKVTRMQNVLNQVNLSVDLNRKIYSLSGGEAQRVAIAKTILKNTPIILADEPTASLDERNSQEIMDLILSLQTKDRCIIIATHDPTVYNRVDTVIKIDKGERT